MFASGGMEWHHPLTSQLWKSSWKPELKKEGGTGAKPLVPDGTVAAGTPIVHKNVAKPQKAISREEKCGSFKI